MTPKILIIGAGELGLSLIHSFLSHPSAPELTILLRPSSKTDLSSLPVKIIYGDISPSSPSGDLVNKVRGYDVVISATGFSGGPGSQLHLAQAVLRAGVRHYIPWQFGVDYDLIGKGSSQPLFDEQLDVRASLRGQSNTRWTIISTGLFTSFLFDPAFGVVNFPNHPNGSEGERERGKVLVNALGKWENKITITSAEEIGKLTSKITLDQPNIPEGVIFISSDTITFSDIPIQLERLGWRVQKNLITIQELEERLRKDKDDVGAKYQLIWARNIGVSWSRELTWNGQNGVRTVSLDEWVENNLPRPQNS